MGEAAEGDGITAGILQRFFNTPLGGLVLGLSLMAGGTGGVGWLTADTSDRYKAAQAAQDFAQRDAAIARLDERLMHLEALINPIPADQINSRIEELERWRGEHSEHSSKYSYMIERYMRVIDEHLKGHK